MKLTKKIALAGLMSALGTVILMLGVLFEVFDLSAGALASVVMIVVYLELGSPYTWLVWLSTSLCTALLGSANPFASIAYFLVFGIYPILKAYIERLPRAFWILPKLGYINIVFAAIVGFSYIIPEMRFETFFGLDVKAVIAIIWVLVNAAFLLFDKFITVMARLYTVKYKKLFARFFK